MIHAPLDRRAARPLRLHPFACACRACARSGPADAPARADRAARACLLMLAGIALTITADLLAGARGLRALLGLD